MPSGLDIYKMLPRTNCRDCGFPTCLAFAMQVAAKKAGLDNCPHLLDEVRQKFLESSAPPIKLVAIGTGEGAVKLGNETVMFRHEETFYHQTAVGISLKDTLSEDNLRLKIKKINQIEFERVGQKLKVDLVALINEGSSEDFKKAVSLCAQHSALNMVLVSKKIKVIEGALDICAGKRPLIYAADEDNYKDFTETAKKFGVPLTAVAPELSQLCDLTKKIKELGLDDLFIALEGDDMLSQIENLTYARKAALKSHERSLGFPQLAFIRAEDYCQKVLYASTLICKYANVLIVDMDESEQILPLLTLRQNIYTDPQKPLAVKAQIYEIGAVKENAPVLITTNFSLSYYTVESEVQASRVPAYILSVDCDGMSVLTAWAADKFNPETINSALNKEEVKEKMKHKNIIIPGYVANLKAKLEEEFGWKVTVGPREAYGIPSFLRNLRM